MVVDAERVLAELKAYFTTQTSFGQRQLLEKVARLEGQAVLDEDGYQRFLRRFAVELDESFRNITYGATDPLTDAPAGTTAMDPDGSPIERAQAPGGNNTWPVQESPQHHPQHRAPPPPRPGTLTTSVPRIPTRL